MTALVFVEFRAPPNPNPGLEGISGIGVKELEAYGEDVVRVVNQPFDELTPPALRLKRLKPAQPIAGPPTMGGNDQNFNV